MGVTEPDGHFDPDEVLLFCTCAAKPPDIGTMVVCIATIVVRVTMLMSHSWAPRPFPFSTPFSDQVPSKKSTSTVRRTMQGPQYPVASAPYHSCQTNQVFRSALTRCENQSTAGGCELGAWHRCLLSSSWPLRSRGWAPLWSLMITPLDRRSLKPLAQWRPSSASFAPFAASRRMCWRSCGRGFAASRNCVVSPGSTT